MILRPFDLPSHLIYLNCTRISGNFARKIFEKFDIFVGILQNSGERGGNIAKKGAEVVENGRFLGAFGKYGGK